MSEAYASEDSVAMAYGAALGTLEVLPTLVSQHRARRAISLRDAAEEIGIGFNTLYRIENGYNFTVDVARLLLVWLIKQEMELGG